MRKSIFLGLPVTTRCNCQCFYCKPGGESICKNGQMELEKMKPILRTAYKMGITGFRLTGGEPGMVRELEKIVEFIMSLGNDTRISINTNGFGMWDRIDFFERFRERIQIVISVDNVEKFIGYYEYRKGKEHEIFFEKYLSAKVRALTEMCKKASIPIRYNVVVNRFNIEGIPRLVTTALDLGVNVKLLDLNFYEEYFGMETDDLETWNDWFVPMDEVRTFLESICEEKRSSWTNWVKEGTGIPMDVYFKNGNWVQVKDSTRGAYYSEFCKTCPYKKNCREGVFGAFLSPNYVLHLSGCKNSAIYFDLKNQDEKTREEGFQKILNLLNN